MNINLTQIQQGLLNQVAISPKNSLWEAREEFYRITCKYNELLRSYDLSDRTIFKLLSEFEDIVEDKVHEKFSNGNLIKEFPVGKYIVELHMPLPEFGMCNLGYYFDFYDTRDNNVGTVELDADLTYKEMLKCMPKSDAEWLRRLADSNVIY